MQDLPSTDDFRKTMIEQNDGSHPAEPYERCSQIVFEAWMKEQCGQQPSIDGRWGLKFISAQEDDDGVTSHLVDQDGNSHVVRSLYVVGCDGGGSTVRKCMGIKMIGGPL
jgi:FAD-dependent monooxygenase